MVLHHIAVHGFVQVGNQFGKINDIHFFHGKSPNISLKDETAQEPSTTGRLMGSWFKFIVTVQQQGPKQ